MICHTTSTTSLCQTCTSRYWALIRQARIGRLAHMPSRLTKENQ